MLLWGWYRDGIVTLALHPLGDDAVCFFCARVHPSMQFQPGSPRLSPAHIPPHPVPHVTSCDIVQMTLIPSVAYKNTAAAFVCDAVFLAIAGLGLGQYNCYRSDRLPILLATHVIQQCCPPRTAHAPPHLHTFPPPPLAGAWPPTVAATTTRHMRRPLTQKMPPWWALMPSWLSSTFCPVS